MQSSHSAKDVIYSEPALSLQHKGVIQATLQAKGKESLSARLPFGEEARGGQVWSGVGGIPQVNRGSVRPQKDIQGYYKRQFHDRAVHTGSEDSEFHRTPLYCEDLRHFR